MLRGIALLGILLIHIPGFSMPFRYSEIFRTDPENVNFWVRAFFFGYGLNYYATIEYYQIFYIVFAIWILQIFLSPLWLRHFYFGPLEWLWRSLTYWKIQPMRKRDSI